MEDIIAKLDDLIVQATKERSHYYVKSVCEEAKAEIERLRGETATIIATESRLAGERWKMYDAERQDHAITKRANADLQKKLEEAEGEIAELKEVNRVSADLLILANHDWYCGCGHWNGANLAHCALCNRTPGGI